MKYFFLTYILSSILAIASIAQSARGVKKIVIDAGHGGHDPGCHGAIANEKDVALSISLKFGKLVEQNLPDVDVLYTRKTDVFVELHNRAKIANEAKADLFICIHCNAGPSSAFGAETYVMGAHKNEANLQVAKRENASILMEDNYSKEYDGFNPNSPEAHIIFSLYQNAFLTQSSHFANNVQTEFREKANRHDREVRQAGFLVLYRTTMPSVLIETGFLTNNNEEKYLVSQEGQDEMAMAIYRAFKKYKASIEGRLKDVTDNDIPKKTYERPKIEIKPQQEIPREVVNEQGLIFRVQFMGSTSDISESSSKFSKLVNVYKYKEKNIYKYTAGAFTNPDEATSYQHQVRQLGFKDAFLVAFKNGERIPINEALAEIK